MRLSRRRVCGAIATTASVALTGCTNGTGTGDSTTTGGTDGPSTDAPFEGCPPLHDADRTVCAASAAADAPVVLRPSATTVESPGTLRFTLSNGGETTLGLNPYGWAVHRETTDGWARVAPDATIEPWREVAPGDAQAWVLGVGTETEPTAAGGTVAYGPLALDAGTYAFSVVAQAAGEWTAYVARFRVA
ncbi:hypothetical protein MBEHAL_0681 [Halarchaeum acidiphilum MH1-52-1]|uniref:Uncharacterized protein n=1 Tax=Halarchaeum acidiphilum MH1-52-1 TaxID=1261545 RepID=U2YDY7_9EURY|nr:hypothetical protein [Halarchaeum acidiphilum]GAD51921.1 hypothetical protein MBEHAL_0681 [Halarchaeum acidiphilum MH1-52-1]